SPSQRPSTPIPAAVIGPIPVTATRWAGGSRMGGRLVVAGLDLGACRDARERPPRDRAHEVRADDESPGDPADERPAGSVPGVRDRDLRRAVRPGLERPADLHPAGDP